MIRRGIFWLSRGSACLSEYTRQLCTMSWHGACHLISKPNITVTQGIDWECGVREKNHRGIYCVRTSYSTNSESNVITHHWFSSTHARIRNRYRNRDQRPCASTQYNTKKRHACTFPICFAKDRRHAQFSHCNNTPLGASLSLSCRSYYTAWPRNPRSQKQL